MCQIKEKIKDKRVVTGYKVAVKIDGKYYSPATGVEYLENAPVPELPFCEGAAYKRACSIDHFRKDIFYIGSPVHILLMSNKRLTAIFINIKSALRLRLGIESSIRCSPSIITSGTRTVPL